MAQETLTTFELATRLKALPTVGITINGGDLVPAQVKKQARKEISLKNTSDDLGFMHAVIVKIDEQYFLLAGPSGVGKTTYSGHLQNLMGAEQLAQDWVAVEYDKDRNAYYASDLNFDASIKHPDRCKLSGVIFLTKGDGLDRDAYVPNFIEFMELLKETFDTATPREFQTLAIFWAQHKDNLPFCGAIPARRDSEFYIADTLRAVIDQVKDNSKQIDVGVIGTGSVGAQLAYQLGQLPYVRYVHMHNRNMHKAKGLALDMNHAIAKDYGHVFQTHEDPRSVYESSEAVFLAYRDATPVETDSSVPERWRRLLPHIRLTQEHALLTSNMAYRGAVFMITNPVDVLTRAMYELAVPGIRPLRSFQVYGVGLEVDAARALYYARKRRPDFSPKDIEVFGNHSDEIVIATNLPSEEEAALLEETRGGSEHVRYYTLRPTYGPVEAAVRSFRGYYEGGSAHVTLIQEGTYIGRKASFSRRIPMISDTVSRPDYERIVDKNRASGPVPHNTDHLKYY